MTYTYQNRLQAVWPSLLVISAVLLIFFAPSLLLEGESLIPSPHGPWIDPGPPGWINFSTAQIVHDALAKGGSPFWSEKIGIGVPLLADPHNAYFSPFSLILYLWPNSYGWDVSILLKVICGLMGVYLLGRSLSLSPWMAAWTASLFMLSGHVFQFLHHFHTNSLVFLPWCLAGLVYGLANQPRRSLWLIGTSLPLMILGGGLLDVVLLALFVALACGFFLLLPQGYAGYPSVLIRSRLVGLPSLAFVLGLLIASIWVLPYLELRQVSISPRTGRSTAYYDDYWYALGLFFNQMMEIPQNPSHWLMKEKQYMSILLVPGALLSVFVLILKRSRYHYFYLALIVYGLVHFLKLYGFGPLQFINVLPILKDVRFEKYIGLYTLGICLVSAYGYEYFFLKNKKTYSDFIGVLAACLIVAIAVILYGNHVETDNELSLFFYLAFALFPAFVYALFLLIKSPNDGLIVGLVSCVVFVNLYVDTDTKFDKRKDLFKYDPLYEKANKLSETGRVFPMLGRGPRIWSAYGVNDIRDISVVHNERYHQFFKQLVEGKNRCWHNFVLCSKHPDTVSLAALRWLGVDLLIISKRQFSQLAQNQDKNWEMIATYKGYQFIRLHDVAPLISFTDKVAQIDSVAQLPQLPEWSNMEESPAKKQNAQLQPNLDNSRATIITKNFQMGNGGEIEVITQSPGYLLIKSQFYPGWKVWVSGTPVPILRVNYLFQAIKVPEGKSTVDIAFLPNSIAVGFLLSLGGILILVGVNIVLVCKNVHNKTSYKRSLI